MKMIHVLLRLLLILLLLYFFRLKALGPLDDFQFNNQNILFNRFIGTIIILTCFFLIIKKTLWLGAWMSTILVLLNLVAFLYENDLNALTNDIQYHVIGFFIWLFGLIILWNERKNIPLIN